MDNDDRVFLRHMVSDLWPMFLVAVVLVGVWAWFQHKHDREEAQVAHIVQAEQRPHCKTVNEMVIVEVEASMAKVEHSTEDQKESWKRRTAGCNE